jgi:hypothetical protein
MVYTCYLLPKRPGSLHLYGYHPITQTLFSMRVGLQFVGNTLGQTQDIKSWSQEATKRVLVRAVHELNVMYVHAKLFIAS